MLVNNAHTLESALNEGLWSFHPSTLLGRMALLGTAFYGHAVVNAGAHELGHYQEAREAGRDIIEFPLWRIFVFQGYIDHSTEPGREGVIEDMSVLSRGLTINMLLANNMLQAAVSAREINAVDSLGYVVNHVFVSTPVMDKIIYVDLAEELHGSDSNILDQVERHTTGISIFNALDPYTLYSFLGIGKYLATGNPTQTLPPRAVPQLNGYLAVPEPLYEMCWYVPWKKGVLSAALRGGNAVENYAALRLGLQHVSWKNMQLSGLVEGISGESVGIAVHGSVLFPMAGMKVGPTFSYKSEGVWTPFMNGLPKRYVAGIRIEL